MLGLNQEFLEIVAFSFGLLAMALAYFMSRVYKTTPLLMLVLSGVVVSSFFTALISVVESIVPVGSKLPTIVFWLLGSLASTVWSTLFPTVPLIIFGTQDGTTQIIHHRLHSSHNCFSCHCERAYWLGRHHDPTCHENACWARSQSSDTCFYRRWSNISPNHG